MSKQIIHYTLADLPTISAELLPLIAEYKICCFVGEIGAGKTSLIKAIGHHLGIYDTTSPTFSLINEYLTTDGDRLYHMDLYRLDTLAEALDIGIEDYLNHSSICLIEWPQVIEPLLPLPLVIITLSQEGEGRKMEVEVRG